jgi:pre-mRNA-splicing factor ATP-dependent RNA helicase DHX16
MEIKPSWLLEGKRATTVPDAYIVQFADFASPHTVAPHFFKPADLEQLAAGDKKMPKTIGASSSSTPS